MEYNNQNPIIYTPTSPSSSPRRYSPPEYPTYTSTSPLLSEDSPIFALTTTPPTSIPSSGSFPQIFGYQPTGFFSTTEETSQNTPQRGQIQFKSSQIQVAPKAQELLNLLADHGISVRVTSSYRPNSTTKQGRQSHHSSTTEGAIDITPIEGQTYADLFQQIQNSPAVLQWMVNNGYGILDETTPETMKRTGATGAHWHIGKDSSAVAQFRQRFLMQYAQKGLKLKAKEELTAEELNDPTQSSIPEKEWITNWLSNRESIFDENSRVPEPWFKDITMSTENNEFWNNYDWKGLRYSLPDQLNNLNTVKEYRDSLGLGRDLVHISKGSEQLQDHYFDDFLKNEKRALAAYFPSDHSIVYRNNDSASVRMHELTHSLNPSSQVAGIDNKGNPKFYDPLIYFQKQGGKVIKHQHGRKLNFLNQARQQNPNFVQRLDNPDRNYILNPDNTRLSHLMESATVNIDGKRKGIVYPRIQEIDGQLKQFDTSKEALDSAWKNQDLLITSPRLARWYSKNYKKYYPALANGGILKLQQGNIAPIVYEPTYPSRRLPQYVENQSLSTGEQRREQKLQGYTREYMLTAPKEEIAAFVHDPDVDPLRDPNMTFVPNFNKIKSDNKYAININNANYIYRRALDAGYNRQQALTIVAHAIAESGADPNARQKGGGPGRGLIQWEDNVSGGKELNRWQKYQAFAEKLKVPEGLDPELYKQTEYLLYEMANPKAWTHGGKGTGYKTGEEAYNRFNSDAIVDTLHSSLNSYIRPKQRQIEYDKRLDIINTLQENDNK